MADTKVSAITAAADLVSAILVGETSGVNKSYPIALFDTRYQASSANLTSWAAITRASGFDTFVATPSSANLASLITDETGTLKLVFSDSPTFTTNITSPKVIGGTGAGSSLSLQSTSGTGTSDFINFLVGSNGATETMRLDTSGRVIIGSTTAQSTISAVNTRFQSHGTDAATGGFGFFNWGNVVGGGLFAFNKSRGGSAGTRGVVSSGDTLGLLLAAGDDGTNFIEGGELRFIVDAAPGANSMPSRLEISTTATGASTPTLRMKIDSVGFTNISGSFGRSAPVTKTADFTVAATENWLINNKAAATCTVTLPSASSFTGREITIKTIQAFTVVSASSNVVPLAGGAAATAILAATTGKWATLVSDGTNWVIMAGN